MRLLSSAVLILAAIPAFAVRFGFALRTPSGEAVRGAQVCAFTGAGTPPAQWFSGSAIDCFSAETVVAFRKGDWNVFGFVEGKYASTHPYLLVVRDDPRDADSGYREIVIDLAPAATVVSTEPLVFYFPGTKKTLAFALPMRTHTMTIPARLPFLPVRVRNGELRFGEPRSGASAGARIEIDDFARPPTRDAVAWLDAPVRPPDDLPLPRVELAGQSPLFADGPLRHRDLVIVKAMPGAAENATLRLSGPTWEPAETAVQIASATSIANVPSLRLAAAAELRVTATTSVAEWLRSLGEPECADGPKQTLLELHCFGERCSATRSVPIMDGQATFASVPAGSYELRLGSFWKTPVSLSPGTHEITLDVPLFSLAGTVTRNRTPVHARLVAGNGSTFTTTGGAYTLRFLQESDRLVIRDCAGDAEFVHLSDEPLSSLTKLDLELPSPRTIRIIDSTTKKPIGGARVHAMALDPGNRQKERFTEVLAPADENGEAMLRRMPLGKFSVCARAEDYAPRCMAGDGDDPLILALTRVETFHGKIENVSDVKGGMLFFVTPDGAQLEAVSVDADGNFKRRRPHGANEHAVFLSISHPLAVLPLPVTGPLRLLVPAAPVRDVVIRTGTDGQYDIGLAIGGVIVPTAALQRHQTMRGRMPFTIDGEAVLVSLVESAPITVYRGFARSARPPHIPPEADVFAIPELRAQFPSAVAGAHPVILP